MERNLAANFSLALLIQAQMFLTIAGAVSLATDDDDASSTDESFRDWTTAGLVLLSSQAALTAAQIVSLANGTSLNAIRGPYAEITRSQDFIRVVLLQENSKVRRNQLRMESRTFDLLVQLIGGYHKFQPSAGAGRPPRPPEHQIAAFLLYVGTRGTKLANSALACIGEGSSYNYITNTVDALLACKTKVVRWPQGYERNEVSQDFELAGCLGALDGTQIRLQQAPPHSQGIYFQPRKQAHCLNLQAVVDSEGRFRSFECGHPGSTHDATVYAASDLRQNRDQYFNASEQAAQYCIADGGYPLGPNLTRPFSKTELAALPPQQRQVARFFNREISSRRSIVERTFGSWKNRFPILYNLPGRSVTELWRLLASLLVLHNLLVEWGDPDGEMEDWEEWDESETEEKLKQFREEPVEVEPDDGAVDNGAGQQEGSDRDRGKALRWAIAAWLWSDHL